MGIQDPKFICDDHCGRLARWLRFIGFDCRHDQVGADSAVLLIAANEERIILTRDHHLAALVLARRVVLLRSSDPLGQLREVLDNLSLDVDRARLLTRCTICNHSIEPADAANMWDRIPPYVQQTKSAFKTCAVCGRVYWEGTHIDRMVERLRGIGVRV